MPVCLEQGEETSAKYHDRCGERDFAAEKIYFRSFVKCFEKGMGAASNFVIDATPQQKKHTGEKIPMI